MNMRLSLILGLLISIIILCCCCITSLLMLDLEPSDEAMIKHFNANKSIFNQIVTIKEKEIPTKNFIRIWTNNKEGNISEQTALKFQELMKKINISSIIISDKKITFTYYNVGLSVSGSSKSFVYSTDTIENTFSDSNSTNLPKNPINYDTGKFVDKDLRFYSIYREFEENWYIEKMVDK